MTLNQTQEEEAVRRAREGGSTANYTAIIEGFAAMGIPVDDIRPRENVFTFQVWKSLGRFVKRGQHGVKISTVLEERNRDDDSESRRRKYRRVITVFHISQTKEIKRDDDRE